MSDWITAREAAEILGVHLSLIPKMIRRGDLTPRRKRPSLSRDRVLELAAARSAAMAERERRDSAQPGPRPPDAEHEWLPTPAAAVVMGCSVVALRARAKRGRMPSVLHQGRRWFRLDHLELLLRAQAAQRLARGRRGS